jgi:hypothetical protein
VPPINPPSFLRRLILALVHMRAVLIGSLPADPKQAQAVRHAWLWLARLVQRLNAFADSYKAGTLKPPRPKATSQTGTETKSKPEARKARPKPAPSGWLALVFAAPDSLVESIAALMAEHEIRLILGQEPSRFGCLLRPLCRALGLPAPKPLTPEPKTATAQTQGATAPRPPPNARPPAAPGNEIYLSPWPCLKIA